MNISDPHTVARMLIEGKITEHQIAEALGLPAQLRPMGAGILSALMLQGANNVNTQQKRLFRQLLGGPALEAEIDRWAHNTGRAFNGGIPVQTTTIVAQASDFSESRPQQGVVLNWQAVNFVYARVSTVRGLLIADQVASNAAFADPRDYVDCQIQVRQNQTSVTVYKASGGGGRANVTPLSQMSGPHAGLPQEIAVQTYTEMDESIVEFSIDPELVTSCRFVSLAFLCATLPLGLAV